jgi:hypothetical protein
MMDYFVKRILYIHEWKQYSGARDKEDEIHKYLLYIMYLLYCSTYYNIDHIRIQ